MKHSIKRILSLVLTLAMVLSCVPAQAFATEGCDHSYEVTVTEPTCTEDGIIDFVCSLCGDSYSEPGVVAEGHDYQETERIEAACTEDGSVTYECTVCGDAVEDVLPAVGHSYAEGYCALCGAEDPDAAPAEEPEEEPAEEPEEEPDEELIEQPAPEPAAESPDGDSIVVGEMGQAVAMVAKTGETYSTLEAAILAVSSLDERTVLLLEDYTVTQPIHIYTDVLLYNEAGAEPHTITAAEGVDTLFDVGKNGFLLADHVNMASTGGDYIIELTAPTAGLLLNTCDLSGAAAAAVHVADNVHYVAEEITNEDGSTGKSANIQIYGGTLTGEAALHLEGTGSVVFVAGESPVLTGNGSNGAIVMDGDGHSIVMYGITMNSDSGIAFTMNGNSVLQAGGVTFNGDSYDDPWNTALPQSGAVARMDIGYYADLQAAIDAATEVNYEAGENEDTSNWSIPLTVLEELTISETITVEDTQFPLCLGGKDITLTEDGVIRVNGYLHLDSRIYMGLGTVYVPEGGQLEFWAGDVIGFVTWPEDRVDHISAYWVHNQGEGWFENIYQYHPNAHSIRMVPGEDHFLSFYKNVWDEENGRWIRTSVAPGEMNLPEYLSVNPLSEYDWIEFRDGEANAANYVDLIVEPDMPWDTTPLITVDGIPYTVNVARESNFGFYSAPEAENENWLINYRYNRFRQEDSFYFVFTADGFTLDHIALSDDGNATMEATDDPNVYKITLTDAARALDEGMNDYHDFDIRVSLVAVDGSGHEHYWDGNLYCEPWIWNAVDGGEMAHADLMFAIDAMQNVNDWAGAWIHESVTVLDPNVNGGVLDISMGVRESDHYDRVFELADAGKIIVPDGCTLIINSRTTVTGGLIEILDGGKLIVNTILHAGTGTIYLHDNAELEDNFGLRMTPMTWESDAKEDFISAAYANAENNVFYATIDEFDMPAFQEYQMLPGYGNPLVFYFNHWNGEKWDRTPIHPYDLETDDGLTIGTIEDVGGTVRDDQEYGDCFAMLWAKDGEELWDTTQYIYYGGCSFPVHLQRSQDMGFYSAPEVSNHTFLDSFGFGPGRDNTFYFIVTDEGWTATDVTAQIEEGPNVLEGGVVVTEYAENIWKIQLEDDVVANMNRNIWLKVRVELEDAQGNVNRLSRGMDCYPWTWNLGMPDAGFGINGLWYQYYADADTYMAWIEDESYADGGYRTEVKLPEGVSYDIATNTMTLNNVAKGALENLNVDYHWQGEDENGDFVEGWDLPNPDFTLKLIGENYIGDGSKVALWLGEELNATITGDGSLYVFNNNENAVQYNTNAAEVYNASLTISGAAKVTFHVEGENYWDDGSPALMHALWGSNNATLRVTDNAVLTMEVPEITRDARPGQYNGGYQGLVGFGEVIVEKQATVNLDSLEVSDGQIFHLKGGTVNLNAHPSIHVMNEETGDLRYYYDAVLVNEGGQLNVNGGKLNVTAASTYENARYTGFKVENGGNLNIFGGSINLSTNVLGPAIHVGGERTSWLYMGGGTFTYTDDYTGEEQNTLINVEHNSRARFNGGTILADGGVMNLMALSPEDEMEGVTWTGTSLKGNGTWIIVHGNLAMSNGLIQLNEGRMEVENRAVFTGGTLDMNDSTMIVNGTVYADVNARLDFDMTDRAVELYEDSTAIEINNYFAICGGAQVNVDVSLENIQNENGENIPFSGIRNHAMFHQMGGTVTINSNAYADAITSYGNMLLNAGEMNLMGVSGIQQEFNENKDNIFEMREGMTLNVDATRCGIALADTEILGGAMNIVVNGDNGTFGLYSLPGATMNITGGIHNIVAHSSGEGTVGLGLVADGSYMNIGENAVMNVEADEAAACWMLPADTTTTIIADITDMETGNVLNNWKLMEDNSLLVHADGAAATKICINANAAPKTLQEILPELEQDPNDGSYMLAWPVVVNESMRLVDANGSPITLHVIRGGKITVRSGAVLTIPVGGTLVAHSNWEDNGIADGAIIVEAGGRILNNGVLANDGGYVSIQNSSTKAGYVHGGNAAAVSHYANGEFSFIQGVAESYQEVNATISNVDELMEVLDEVRDYEQDGEKIRYRYAYIWTPNSMKLDGVVIPEDTELAIDGQDATAVLTISEGAALHNSGKLSLGNVDLTVVGGLYNFGEIMTDIHDNARITLNGNYFAGDNGHVFLNNANVEINGEYVQNAGSSGLDINDASVVTVTADGRMQIRGGIHVGCWKNTAGVENVAGTLDIYGTVEIYDYLGVDTFGETTGGVVNVKDGGELWICRDDASGIYGTLELNGEMNIEAGGALEMENYMSLHGVLNVAGRMCNRGESNLYGELNISGDLYNQVGDDYYGNFYMFDTEDGSGSKLVASEGANIVNDGSIRSIGCNGLIDMEKAATFVSDAESAEVCLDWGPDGALTECRGVDKSLTYLIYEGDDAGAAVDMAAYSEENGYRASIVRVVGRMEVGYDQHLNCDYLIVMPNSELEVNGFAFARTRLFVRQGSKLTIGTNGWVTSGNELWAFAGDDYFGNSVIENRGALECSNTGTMRIEGDYHDFGTGTIYNILTDGSMGQIEGVGTDGQTLFTNVMGENGEQQLRDLIAMIREDGYGYGIINVFTDVAVGYDLDIPENVRVRITEEGENIGSMTVYNDAYVNNMGTIVANRPYAALLIDSGSYGGNGVYYGYCGSDAERRNENLLWTLQNGTMTISGDGAMADYAFDAPAPWLNLNVSKVILGAGVTYIGDFAFQKCYASMVIPKGLQYFGTYCFSGTSLKVYHNSAAEAYLQDNYSGEWDYIHEVADGVCIVDGCGYGLNDVLNNEGSTAEQKKEELKNFDAESLKDAMADETFQGQLENLEQEIQTDVVVRVEDGTSDTVADAFASVDEDASILGAVLNAEEGVNEVHLVLGDPENASIGDAQFGGFNAEASVLFSMNLQGVGNDAQLDIPVKITLPVPANVGDLSKLVVMHYHDGSQNGQKVDYTLFTNEQGKAFVSFVITGFSNFLIGEEIASVTLRATVKPGVVTTAVKAEDISISISHFKDLNTSYIIQDENGNEVELEDAVKTPGTYHVIPTYVPNSKYNVTVDDTATLTVQETVNVCVNTTTGASYESISAALAAAKSGETIRLENDHKEVGVITIPSGVILDLATYELSADYVVAFKGAYLTGNWYSTKTDFGRLNILKDHLILGEDTLQAGKYKVLPVYDATNGYYVISRVGLDFSTAKQGLYIDETAQSIEFIFGHKADVNAAYFKPDGGENTGIKVVVEMIWKSGEGVAYQEFEYTYDQVKKVAGGNNSYTFKLNQYEKLGVKLEDVIIRAKIVSDCGAVAASDNYTIANDKLK